MCPSMDRTSRNTTDIRIVMYDGPGGPLCGTKTNQLTARHHFDAGLFQFTQTTFMTYQLTSGQITASLQLPESAVVFNANDQSTSTSLATALQFPLSLPPIEQCVVPGGSSRHCDRSGNARRYGDHFARLGTVSGISRRRTGRNAAAARRSRWKRMEGNRRRVAGSRS